MLKARLSQSVTIGEVKTVKEYLKETVFEEEEIRKVVSSWMREKEIGLTEILKIELTAYPYRETVVHVTAQGIRHDVGGTHSAFVEIYYIYEKGLDDVRPIIRVYKEDF